MNRFFTIIELILALLIALPLQAQNALPLLPTASISAMEYVTHSTPGKGTAAYFSTTELTMAITGITYSDTTCAPVYVYVVNAAGKGTLYTNGVNGVVMRSSAANRLKLSYAGFPFLATDLMYVTGFNCGTTNVAAQVEGTQAEAAASTANPVQIGGKAEASTADVATGQVTHTSHTLAGRIRSEVRGEVADNAAASGTNPIVSAGVYKATPSDQNDGDVAPVLTDIKGRPLVGLTDVSGNRAPSFDVAGRAGFAKLTDGTNTAAVIATILSLKTDLSSIAGTVTAVNNGAVSDGVQRVTVANDSTGQTRITDGTDQASVLARTTGAEQPAVTDEALVVYDVGGGAASVTAEYEATTAGRNGTATYASGTTITLAGFPFTCESEDIVFVREVDETGNTAKIWVNGTAGVQMEVNAACTLLTRTGGTDFTATAVFTVGYNGEKKGYAVATNSVRTAEINPLSEMHVEETLLALTNIAQNTTAYAYLDMDGYRMAGIQCETSDAVPTDVLTVTLECSIQDDGTAAASCTYQDCTNQLTGSASFVDSDFIMTTPSNGTLMALKYLRIKYNTSAGGGNDADLTCYVKRMW